MPQDNRLPMVQKLREEIFVSLARSFKISAFDRYSNDKVNLSFSEQLTTAEKVNLSFSEQLTTAEKGLKDDSMSQIQWKTLESIERSQLKIHNQADTNTIIRLRSQLDVYSASTIFFQMKAKIYNAKQRDFSPATIE